MYSAWYEEHYHEMSGAGLWFHPAGMNLLSADTWDNCSYRVLVARLSTARDTVDSFTHQLLYQTIAKDNSIFVDCAWLPPPEDADLFDRWSIPWLTGIVSKRPALQFDCIAFSNSIVEELVNLPILLKKSGIPIDMRERLPNQQYPLILLGGANAINTTLIAHEASPVDALFIGEDTQTIRHLFTECRMAKLQKRDKPALLEQLLTIDGIMVPNMLHQTTKKMVPFTQEQVLNGAPVFFGLNEVNNASLQISEGCPCFCTFCSESWNRKPYRELPFEDCLSTARQMKLSMGIGKVDLYSFNFTMHERCKDLLLHLFVLFNTIGLKSQRLDGIADDPDLMKILHVAGKSSITVGIEGVSSRLRVFLQKGLDESKLRLGLKRILETPIRELKLFFVITGNEQEDDINEFRELLLFINECMRAAQRRPRIIISITSLVRFPFTPLEHDSAPEPSRLAAIIQQCERLTEAKRFEFRTAASMNDYLVSQILVRASDIRVWNALCAAITATGFIYYKDFTDHFIDTFRKELVSQGLGASQLLSAEKYTPLQVVLPVDNAFIEMVSLESQKGSDIGYCLGTESGEGQCKSCKACSNPEEIKQLTSRRPRKNLKPEQLKSVILQNSKNCKFIVKCTITASYRGIPRNNIAACIARAVMAYDTGTIDGYHGYLGSYIIDRCGTAWIHGDDLLYLSFHESLRERLKVMSGTQSGIDALNKALAGVCTISELSVDTQCSDSLMLKLSTPWKCNPVPFLSLHALKFTLTKGSGGRMCYQFTKDALRKKVVSSLMVFTVNDTVHIEITPQEKFDYKMFVSTVVELPTNRHLYRIETTATIF